MNIAIISPVLNHKNREQSSMKNFYFVIIFFIFGCAQNSARIPELQMTSEELVSALVQLYSANAAININDINLRDSTSKVYYKQIETIVGKPMDVIQSDLEKLKEMPDSLLVLQSMALDTLRAIQEKQLLKPKGISIGLN